MKARGLVEDESTFTPAGRQTKDRVEALTDELAAAPYEVLEPAELDELIAALEPLAQGTVAAQDEGSSRSMAVGRSGEESTMRHEQAAPETKGVAVELLATIDLGPEIQGMDGRQLRMRMVTIEPGGVFGPVHDHKGRPGTVYVLQGTITDHRDGVATDYGPGLGWPEDRNTIHWLENRGPVTAMEISVDVVRHDYDAPGCGTMTAWNACSESAAASCGRSDPEALGAWYRELPRPRRRTSTASGEQEAGPTVFATFESDTDYFGSRTQQTMLNFRVRDLDAMLAQLRASGADVADETQDMDGVGRFGWVTDPEGNRIELWQPS